MPTSGPIPSQDIVKLIKEKRILTGKHFKNSSIQPASVDLRVGRKAYQLDGKFLPYPGEKIEKLLAKNLGPHSPRLDLSKPAHLNVHTSYLIEIEEALDLPDHLFGTVNPKSSTGRVDLQVQTIIDGYPRYDQIPLGYKGKLYVIVTPNSWPVIIREGEKLNQLRLFQNRRMIFSDADIRSIHHDYGIVLDESGKPIPDSKLRLDNGLLLGVDLSRKIVSYTSHYTGEYLDLSRRNIDSQGFFQPVSFQGPRLILVKDRFYIFSTVEKVRVPPNFAAEMSTHDPSSGEFRAHFAGFFDPGFGYGRNGEIRGANAVLEVRPHDTQIILRHDQPICRLLFEEMVRPPERVYGDKETETNYQAQKGPKLAKYFIGGGVK
jgi:dCTP deaminase